MSLYRTTPPPSGRMGMLWALSTIRQAAVIEFGCMGHMAYGRTFLHRMGAMGGKLYSTHIHETDIAMGDLTRLNQTVRQVIDENPVKVIFLLPSSIPEIIGVDLAAAATELAVEYPDVQFISFALGGFDVCSHKGVEQTLLTLVKEIAQETMRTVAPVYNIIGSCPDIFRFQSDAAEIRRIMRGVFDMECRCTMTSDTDIADLRQLGCAHLNLVIRREGEAAAEYLYQRFGTPYVVARPYGIGGTLEWVREIEKSCGFQPNEEFLCTEQDQLLEQTAPIQMLLQRFIMVHPDRAVLTVSGHADVVRGIIKYGQDQFGFQDGGCFCDCVSMAEADMPFLTDRLKAEIADSRRDFLMGSDELLQMAGKGPAMQIANPDSSWRHPYEPPLMGFRGALHLAVLWANEMMRID